MACSVAWHTLYWHINKHWLHPFPLKWLPDNLGHQSVLTSKFNLPTDQQCIIHCPYVFQDELNKKRSLHFGLCSPEYPFWLCMKEIISPKSFLQNICLDAQFCSIQFSKVSNTVTRILHLILAKTGSETFLYTLSDGMMQLFCLVTTSSPEEG